jgi:hypothetical protein
MGSNHVEVTDVVFDTGSSWLVMETSDCAACEGKYDITSSTAYAASVRPMSQSYGDGTSITGVQASDDACILSSSLCLSGFNWMNIQTDGLGSDLNGILGLSHNPSAFSDLHPADDMITALAEAGVIPANTFALGLRSYKDPDNSFMDVGFFNDQAMHNPSELIWTDIVTDSYYGDGWWQSFMTGVRFRDQEIGTITHSKSLANAQTFSTVVHEVLSIIDSGSSCLVLSTSVFNFVITQLKGYLESYSIDASWGTIFGCSTNLRRLPIIGLLYGGYWLEASVDDYVT